MSCLLGSSKCIWMQSKKRRVGMGKIGLQFLEAGREWRLPGLSYADDLVLCGDSKFDLKVI